MSTSPLMTKKQVAERLHTSVWVVEERLIKTGFLPVVPVGSRTRIRPEDLQAYIDQAAPGPELITVTY